MADRMLREVTREEWMKLPAEVSYARADLDRNDVSTGTRYYEIVTKEVRR